MDLNGSGGALPDYFELRPTRAAKVSEISEATASSSIEPEERVNFHIGNPVQESRLSSAYLRAALGLDIRDETLSEEDPAAILRAMALDEPERHRSSAGAPRTSPAEDSPAVRRLPLQQRSATGYRISRIP